MLSNFLAARKTIARLVSPFLPSYGPWWITRRISFTNVTVASTFGTAVAKSAKEIDLVFQCVKVQSAGNAVIRVTPAIGLAPVPLSRFTLSAFTDAAVSCSNPPSRIMPMGESVTGLDTYTVAISFTRIQGTNWEFAGSAASHGTNTQNLFVGSFDGEFDAIRFSSSAVSNYSVSGTIRYR